MNYKFDYEFKHDLTFNCLRLYLKKEILDLLDNPKEVSIGLDLAKKALCVTLPVEGCKKYKIKNSMISFSGLFKNIVKLMNLKSNKRFQGYSIPLIEIKDDYFLIFDLNKVKERNV